MKKTWGAVLGPGVEDLSDTWGEELFSLVKEASIDFEKQSKSKNVLNDAPALDKIDSIHTIMMEFKTLLEASGERNLRSNNFTHGDYPCHCVAQNVWYPEKSNLCLMWDVEEIRAIGLPDHQQKVTIFVVSSMLAQGWSERNVIKYRE